MAATLGSRITTIMREKLLAKVTDQVLRSNVAFKDVVSKAKKWSGSQIKFPVKYAVNNTGTSFSGFQALSTSAVDNRVKATFDPSFVAINSALPFTEVVVNLQSGNEEAVLDLVKTTLTSDAQDLADLCGTQFWGDGTGNGGLDLLGLGALVDDGSAVPTYGGLARSTYAGMAGTVTASGGSITLQKMLTLYFNVTNGEQRPTVAYTTQAVFSLYNSLLIPLERFMNTSSDVVNGSKRGTGAKELYFEGLPVKADQKCPAGVFMLLNEDYIDWYAIDPSKAKAVFDGFEASNYSPDVIEGNDYGAVAGLGFGFTGWTRAQNGVSANGYHVFGGQLIGREPRFNGKLTGVTSAA